MFRNYPRRAILPLLLVLLAALATYRGALDNAFVWDDHIFIADNPALEELRNVPSFFVNGDAVGTPTCNPYYRPLTTTSFAVGVSLWGDDPAGFHAVGVLLHLAVCAMVFLTVRRMAAHPAAPFAAALLFAVHPANSEPVAYISARADLLCALLMLASLRLFLSDLEARSPWRRVLSCAAYFLALLAKITAGVLPAVMAAHIAASGRWKEGWRRLVPYGAIAVCYLAIRDRFTELDSWYGASQVVRAANAGPNLLAYLRNALFPWGLKVIYPVDVRVSFADPHVLLSWGVVIFVTAAALTLAFRRRPAAVLGLSWFFAALLPVSGIFLLLLPSFIADRYLYIPLAGLAVALGVGVDALMDGREGRAAAWAPAVVAACLAVPLSLYTANRVETWRDSLTLWEHAARGAPDSTYVMNNLGAALKNAGRYDEAEAVLLKALSIEDVSDGPHVNLAAIECARGNLGAAMYHTLNALRINPGNAVIHNNLGVILVRMGERKAARERFEEALRLWPDYRLAQANLMNLERDREASAAPAATAD